VADDKTRILSAAEAARLFTRKPKVVGDKVVFYCDNGHRIVAPVRDGGKRGNCSKCAAPVTVPAAVADEAAEGATMILSAPKESRVASPGEGILPASNGEESPAVAPPSGGVSVDEALPAVETAASATAAAEPAAAPPAEEEAGAVESAAADAGGWQFMQPAGATADAEEPLPQADGQEGWFGHPDAADADDGDGDGGDNPTARLVARLWVEHELGGTLELHLQDGSVILPQSYEPRWSRGTHGLFAAAAPDGSITLTAVAWESVQKIVVRNVKGLPDGMFE